VAAGTVDVTDSPTKISLEWPLENYYVSITSIGKAAQVFVSDKSEEGFFVNAATEQTVRIDYIVYAKSENIKKAILKRKSLNTNKQHP
ncbi:MAG TPA: hypothetical protein VJ946_13785, partial [Bacteroidales bacterium]|nr:hypothetical protein [Bacteroidales bacterium]